LEWAENTRERAQSSSGARSAQGYAGAADARSSVARAIPATAEDLRTIDKLIPVAEAYRAGTPAAINSRNLPWKARAAVGFFDRGIGPLTQGAYNTTKRLPDISRAAIIYNLLNLSPEQREAALGQP
jgi:hypothetical protein